MNKDTLLAALNEVLKDIHPSNLPVKTVAQKTIEAIFTEEKEEYEIKMDKTEADYFFPKDPWDTIGIFNSVFDAIGMKAHIATGNKGGVEYITVKIAA